MGGRPEDTVVLPPSQRGTSDGLMEMLTSIAGFLRQENRQKPALILVRLAGPDGKPEEIVAPDETYAVRMRVLQVLAEIKRWSPIMFA